MTQTSGPRTFRPAYSAPTLHGHRKQGLWLLGAGLPESELRTLLGAAGDPNATPAPNADAQPAPPASRRARPGSARSRRPPSLARGLLQALLLQPGLVASVDIPHPDDGTPEGAALAAVIECCARTPMNTPALIQHFVGTAHESVIVAALTTTEDQETTPEQAESMLRDGVAKWIARNEARETDRLLATPLEQMSPEQREAMRQRLAALKVQPR